MLFFLTKLSTRRQAKAQQTDLQTCQTHMQTDGTTQITYIVAELLRNKKQHYYFTDDTNTILIFCISFYNTTSLFQIKNT